MGVDAHMLGTEETGNESYVRGLLEGLGGLENGPQVVAYVGPAPGLQPSPGLSVQRLRAPGSIPRLSLELAVRSRRDHLDVLHSTYLSPEGTATPNVLMVHDISYLTHPEWLSGRDALVLRLGVARSVARAAQVVVPTETIRGQVVETYGVDAARVHAIPHGPGAAAQKLSIEDARRVLTHLGADSAPPYLLVVGGATPRKNLVALIEAFGRVKGFGGDLVLAGAATGSQAAAVARTARRLAGRVVITHHLRDREVAALYQQARAVAVPSLHEGFGLTALEAMWHGIPVAASDDPALREVCGESAAYFDPGDPESIAAALEAVLLDETERARLVEYGRLRAGRFTWETSAAAHVAVYRLAAEVGAQNLQS